MFCTIVEHFTLTFRQLNLQAAEHLYRFETDVSSLTSWMRKAREKLAKITESRNVKETKAMLDMYNQIKSELKIREEVYDRVQKYGEALFTQGGLQPEEVYPKLQKLDKEKEELEALLKEKDFNLKHSFDIQVRISMVSLIKLKVVSIHIGFRNYLSSLFGFHFS